jgi:hypothetical protein
VAKHGPEVGSAVVSAVQVGPTRVVVVFKVSNVTVSKLICSGCKKKIGQICLFL